MNENLATWLLQGQGALTATLDSLNDIGEININAKAFTPQE